MKKKFMCLALATILLVMAVPAFADYVSLSTWSAMESDWKDFPVCKKDRTRSANYALQRVLRAQNTTYCQRIDGSGGCDGAIGSTTDELIKAFQNSHGLTADGIVGEATWDKLFLSHEDRSLTINTSEYYRLRKKVDGTDGTVLDTAKMKQSDGAWYAEKKNGSFVKFYD